MPRILRDCSTIPQIFTSAGVEGEQYCHKAEEQVNLSLCHAQNWSFRWRTYLYISFLRLRICAGFR